MKAAVIYKSHYGSTEAYAKWMAEDLSADLLKAEKLKPADLQKYDIIIYGGGIYAGGVNGIDLLTKALEVLKDKKLFIFTVCGSDATKPENIKAILDGMKQKLPSALFDNAHIYHLRGGIAYSKMSFLHKMMMNMMIKMLSKKPENELTDDDKGMLGITSQDTDFTSRQSIAPIVADIKAAVQKTA